MSLNSSVTPEVSTKVTVLGQDAKAVARHILTDVVVVGGALMTFAATLPQTKITAGAVAIITPVVTLITTLARTLLGDFQ